MATDEQPRDFGRYLQACRINKGISLDAISRLTRITKAILKQIESEDMAQLPAPVFVKGFLRSYAEAVGADKDEALARYQASLKITRQTEQSQTSWEKPSPLLPRILIALVAVGAVIAATLFVSGHFLSRPAKEQIEPSQTPASVAPTPEPAASQDTETAPETRQEPSSIESPPEEGTKAAEENKRLVLKVAAVEPTWLKIIADDQKPQEYTLAVGDTLTLEARKQFSLLIGNAAGVQLTFNGNPVAVPGKSGQVVTLQLP